MEKVDYPSLYALQDRVLSAIFRGEATNFYLTGGTCLHRFYSDKRYSDDLDLFSNENNLFREDVRTVLASLAAVSFTVVVMVDSRDFVRLLIDSALRVDLVNDRVRRVGKIVSTADGLLLDNMNNIGANKICALLGRDDPKDIFDLYTLFRTDAVQWPTIMQGAVAKCAFDMEALRFRLLSFPLELLDLLSVSDGSFVAEMKRDYLKIIECLLAASLDGDG